MKRRGRWLGTLRTAEPRGPVQAGFPCERGVRLSTLPVGVLELAYEEYSYQYGTDQSLARMNERGGFGVGEVIGLLADLVERERGLPGREPKTVVGSLSRSLEPAEQPTGDEQ